MHVGAVPGCFLARPVLIGADIIPKELTAAVLV